MRWRRLILSSRYPSGTRCDSAATGSTDPHSIGCADANARPGREVLRTRQVAPQAAPTRAVAPAEKSFGKERIASQSVPARAVSTEVGDPGQPVTATASRTHEWNDQSFEDTLSAPTVCSSSASELVDLIDDDLAPFDDPGPMGPVSSIMLAVQGWASRQFDRRFAKHTPVATVAETTR